MTEEKQDLEGTRFILEHVEETLSGLVHLEKNGNLDQQAQVFCIHTLAVAVMALDLFLTGNVENRGKKDHLDAAPVLSGEPWIVELSDGMSALILRKPTRGDRRMVFLDESLPDRLPDADVKTRWETLLSGKKAPDKFPVTDALFA